MNQNPLRALEDLGQSVWLDYMSRGALASGELKRYLDEDDLRGVTSNPTIFDEAITGSRDYDDDMNVICLGGHVVGDRLALELASAFLEAHFSGAERHRRRLAEVAKLEPREGLR